MESTNTANRAASSHLVWLVDDEKPFTDLLQTLLQEGLGLRTVAFNDPFAALRALDEQPNTGGSDQPTLIISDLVMPRMNGFAFLREAIRRRPGLPSILVTGSDPDAATVAANQPANFLGLIHKPVSWKTVAALLRQNSLLP